MNRHVDGFVTSPFSADDKRFNDLELTPVETTKTLIEIPEFTPISQQGQLPFCVANAGCDAIETVLGVLGLPVVQISRNFTHYNARLQDGTADQLIGTNIRSFFAGIEKFGVCPETAWPYSHESALLHPSTEAYQEADCNLGLGVYRVEDGAAEDVIEADLLRALRANHPMIFGVEVGQELVEYTGGVDAFDHPTMVVGRHAVLAVGYDVTQRRVKVRNSWGRNWGNMGYCWMSLSYLATSLDRWVVTSSKKVVGRD